MLQQHAIGAHRFGNVLEALFAQRLEGQAELVVGLIVRCSGDDDAARIAQSFQAGGDVDAVAVEIVLVDDHVAQVDPDAEHDPGVLRQR